MIIKMQNGWGGVKALQKDVTRKLQRHKTACKSRHAANAGRWNVTTKRLKAAVNHSP